ncbi:MAG: phosphatase PAP2 family protein [Gammaproteobacteria bacterium]|nr:phosphatase PAP2 family protein [Gammaproteobacteria bacterium]
MSQTRQPSSRKSHLPEYTTEFIVIGVSLGLYGFIKLTEEVTDGDTRGFDRDMLLMFRNPQQLSDPIGPAWLEVVVRDITALGGLVTLALLTIAACGYLWLKNKHRLAVFVAVSVSGGTLINTLLKGFIERPRPVIVPHETTAALSSFPSGHAMMSAVVFLTLGALLALASDTTRIKVYFLAWSVLLTVLVGISRVYLGVHWPTDVLAGWIAGATWALLCLLASRIIVTPNSDG